MPLASMGEQDPTMVPYAAHFIMSRRADASHTFKDTMSLSLPDVSGAFKPAGTDAGFPDAAGA